MKMHPFLDTTKLTDEEILERLSKAYSFLSNQTMLGHNPTVVSIKEVIKSLEDERAGRMVKSQDEDFKRKYPNSQKPIELGKLED
jgi:hypothetical protein